MSTPGLSNWGTKHRKDGEYYCGEYLEYHLLKRLSTREYLEYRLLIGLCPGEHPKKAEYSRVPGVPTVEMTRVLANTSSTDC